MLQYISGTVNSAHGIFLYKMFVLIGGFVFELITAGR